MQAKDLLRFSQKLNILYVVNEESISDEIEPLLKSIFNSSYISKGVENTINLLHNSIDSTKPLYDFILINLNNSDNEKINLTKKILELSTKDNIIIYSQDTNSKNLIELINLGIKKFISKPLNKEQFFQVIYNLSQKIYLKNLDEQSKQEIKEYNNILKNREDNIKEEINEHTKKLQEFTDALNDSSIVSKTDIDGNITFVNELFCQISGYTENELIGQNHNILNGNHFIKSYYKKLWNTITAKKTFKTVFKNRTKDGKTYYIDSLIKPIINKDGNITEYISIANDITSMITSKEKLKASKKAKDEFFNNMSHEMRTPLNAIIGILPLLKKQSKNNEKALVIVDMIQKSSAILNSLIESLITLQKLNENSFIIEKYHFNPHEMFKKIINKYIDKALLKEQKVKVFIDEYIPNTMIGDAKAIEQVINFILDNAIKFTDSSGSISIKCTFNKTNSELVCAIKDTGIGIDKKNFSSIFEMYQVDSSLSRKYEGAGLGLTMAKKILSKMHGYINVNSKIDVGSIFTISIPLEQST